MKRSKFSLSHFKLLTCKMGQLVPVTWFEVLPGDTIQQSTRSLIRAAAMATPAYHPCVVRFHHWFVPNRLVWSNWQDFITGGPDGLNASAVPTIAGAGAIGSLVDYLGVPTTSSVGPTFSALPCRAYQLIWNEFYRDEDLQTKAVVSLADGSDTTTSLTLQNVCWEKDYLTSARPWAQKGAVVTLPLGTAATVKTSSTELLTGAQPVVQVRNATTGAVPASKSVGTGATGQLRYNDTAPGANPQDMYFTNLFADLSSATAVDVNTVRQAFALQRFEEARARYGSRYTEYLRYLGVKSSDARLQRPEYLGGGKSVIQFSEVLQTGPGAGGTGIGNLFGHGITAMRTNRYRRFFEEHGIVMTLMSVRPKTMYTHRMARKFMRGISAFGGMAGNKNDYWQRELQHIGQQGVNAWEADAGTTPSTVFGYQDRYDEYRREESSIAGLFKSTLASWHLSRDFGTPPALNSTFVSCVPSTRIFQDLTSDNLYVMANHSIQARRLVSREGTSMSF